MGMRILPPLPNLRRIRNHRMATDHTTDKHDESDTAQFGDDPHNLRETPFEETECADCHTYLVKAKNYTGQCRCLECARYAADIDWASGQPLGEWHPTVGYERPHTPQKQKTPNPQIEWQWGCIDCQQTGPAHSADHATTLFRTHQCPPK